MPDWQADRKETFFSPPLLDALKEIKRKLPSTTGIERGAKNSPGWRRAYNKVSCHPSAPLTAGNETLPPVPALAMIN